MNINLDVKGWRSCKSLAVNSRDRSQVPMQSSDNILFFLEE
jgi:hypothetical protein